MSLRSVLRLFQGWHIFRQYLVPLIYCSFSFLMTAMEELDGDTVRLSSRGRYAERDIVQVKKPSV